MCLSLRSTKSPNLASTSSKQTHSFYIPTVLLLGQALTTYIWFTDASRSAGFWDPSLFLQFTSEKAMAPHSSTLAWKNPMDAGAWWAVIHGVAKSRTRLSDFPFNFHFHSLEKEMATHSGVLAWRIPGMGEPSGLLSMGLHRVGYDWNDLAAAAAIY